MAKEERSGAAPSTPNTGPKALIFGHDGARDVRRAGKPPLHAGLARRGSYFDRNVAHRKFRSKNLGGSPLSIMATERPNGAPGDPVGRPKPPPHPQKSIGTCLCMCWPALLNGDSLGQRMGTVIKHAVGDVPQTNRKLYFLAGTSLKIVSRLGGGGVARATFLWPVGR